jgi:hypothetical protein
MNKPIFASDMMVDAQAALGFVVSQTSHIETEVYSIPYPAIRYAEMVPVDTSAHEFATSVTFFTQDAVGKAKLISPRGDDIPLANILRTKFEQGILDAGIGYEFGLIEIGQAQMLGRSLPTDGAAAARLAFETMVDEVTLIGAEGYEGLYNTTGIASAAAGTTFAAGTPEQTLAIINNALTLVMTSTEGIEMADTIVLPLAEFGIIATKRIDATSSMTILEFIQKGNVYTAMTGRPLTIMADRRLTSKMVVYRRSPEVLKLHMPMPLRFIPPQLINLAVRVPGMFRFAPLSIRKPKAVRYVTGI